MTDNLDFKLERQGFPVKIGNNEFFIGTSMEDLQHFFTMQAYGALFALNIGTKQGGFTVFA